MQAKREEGKGKEVGGNVAAGHDTGEQGTYGPGEPQALEEPGEHGPSGQGKKE